MAEVLVANKEGANNNTSRSGPSRFNSNIEETKEDVQENRQIFSSKMAKLEFLKYSSKFLT